MARRHRHAGKDARGTVLSGRTAGLSGLALMVVASAVTSTGDAASFHKAGRSVSAQQDMRRYAEAEARRAKRCNAHGVAALPAAVRAPEASAIGDDVAGIVATILDVTPEAVKASGDLACGVGADSLEAVEIIMALEDKYELSIPDGDAEKLTTFPQLVIYLESKMSTQRA